VECPASSTAFGVPHQQSFFYCHLNADLKYSFCDKHGKRTFQLRRGINENLIF
jgi:hypothetical protein